MATIPLTATVDDIDRLTVHFDTGRDDGALFWDFDDLDGGHIAAPPNCAHRYRVPGDYSIDVRAENGDTGTATVTVPPADVAPPPPGPKITSITPNSGPAAGNTIVEIVGTGFTGATIVKLNGDPIIGFVVADDAHISGGMTPAGQAGAIADLVVGITEQNATALPNAWVWT